MKNIKEIPATPEILTCQKHGEYEMKYMDMFGKIKQFDACSKCVKEKEISELERSKVVAEEKRLDRINDRKLYAGVSNRYLSATFESINQDRQEQKEAVTLLKNLCQNIKDEKEVPSIIITGSVGTGKTMMCSAVINELCVSRRVKIVKLIHLVRLLKETWSRGSEDSELDIIKNYTRFDLLIIDEVGMQFGSDTESMFLFDIIDGRYENMLPTILVSNYAIKPTEDEPKCIESIIGIRSLDRLRDGGGECISFNWESGRK